MATITASADITSLDFSVLLDMSTANPTAKVTNLSTVVNANNLQWIFEFLSPSGTPIHVGNFSVPDINGVPFTVYNFSEQVPQYLRQLEFGNDPYSVKVSVKDLAGNVFDLTYGASICKPNGNNGKNNFGAADIDVEVKCAQGQLLVTDKTNLIYKSIVGTKVSSSVQLTYPKDEEGNTLSPVTVTSIPALLPIKYEGDGHEVYFVHIYDYALSPNFTVRVRYYFSKIFPVWCNITLQPLFCEIDKIVDFLGRCEDSVESRDKQKELNIINAKMLKAFTGIIEPLSGIDVPELVNEIKDLIGVECDCCRPSGISNVGSALVTDATFTANKVCGDMLLSWANDGNGNISLNYQNATYTFIMALDSESSAFSYVPNVSGCNKQTALKVDLTILSSEILTQIQSNPTLLNILNGITQRAQLSCSGLNGGTQFNFSSCDYSVQLDTTITGKTFTSILIGGNSYQAPSGTLITDAASIQTFLNSLSKGTFVVVYSALTNNTTITSAANVNFISTVTTSVSTFQTVTAVNNNCGLICNILQKVLDFLNAINLLQIKTGVGLTICRFNVDGTVLSNTFTNTAAASDVFTYMADSICNIANYLQSKVLSCNNIKAIFGAYLSSMALPGAADVIPMWLNGNCFQVPLKTFAISIFRLLRTDSDVKSEYCMVTPCSTVSNCSPVTSLSGSGGDTTWTYNWATVTGTIGYKWSIDGTTWNTVTSTSVFIPSLTANTAYVFRVYPVYPAGDGSSCVVSSNFTTTNTGSVCVAPGSLVLNSETSSSFLAAWAAVTGASGYQYRLNGGSWINIGNVLAISPTGLAPVTLYNFDVRAIIGGTPCANVSSASTTTVNTINYTLSSSFNISIDSVTGAGIPALSPTGLNTILNGHQTGMSGSYSIVVSGSIITTTKLDAYINGVVVACVAVTAPGTYNLAITASALNNVIIAIDSGVC